MLNFLETAMAALAAGLTSIVFFKVEFFGVDVPLIVLWLVMGAVFCTVYFLSLIHISEPTRRS